MDRGNILVFSHLSARRKEKEREKKEALQKEKEKREKESFAICFLFSRELIGGKKGKRDRRARGLNSVPSSPLFHFSRKRRKRGRKRKP